MAHFSTIHDYRLKSVELLGLIILTALKRSPDKTAAELQSQIGVPEAYIVGLLQKLKQQGWVESQDGIWTLAK
jgi:DNA-binding IclR family transcriptional regulator